MMRAICDAVIFISAFLLARPTGVLGVDIRELSVPKLVELGSENVVLDCDYDYDEREKMELDIKWYFNDSHEPFFQWVPGQLKRPQVIGELFARHLDLDYAVSDTRDRFKRHRALLLRRPTLDLSGSYTCKVSTFTDEEIRRKSMTIYAPASSIRFEHTRAPSGLEVNVTCSARDVFPLPRIKLTWGPYQLDDSEASVTLHETRGTYNIVVHRVVRHEEMPAPQVRFGCELSIPGTDYVVREESVYEHGGRGNKAFPRVSSGSSADVTGVPICILIAVATLFLGPS